MRLLVYIVVGFSITNSIVFLHIFSWFRRLVSGMSDSSFLQQSRTLSLRGFRAAWLGRLVRCHACMGFWVGAFLSAVCGGFINEYMEFGFPYSQHVADGLFLSGTNFMVWVALRKLGAEEL